MLTPPPGFDEESIVRALATGWGLAVKTMSYRPVGFGSHHWEVTDTGDGRWFVTVDELETKRQLATESLSIAFGRLRASMATAVSLRERGLGFVIAPVPGHDGEPLVRLDDGLSLTLFAFTQGQSFTWGEFAPDHRDAVLALLIALHQTPGELPALTDEFIVPQRDELEAALAGSVPDSGPYAQRCADLLSHHSGSIQRLLDRYDTLVSAGLASPERMVLTHGEPHPGNTMRTPAGYVLIDWDTALIAPPERDLWALDPGNGAVHAAYAAATGVTPHADMLELYRLRWDLSDIAVDAGRFRRPHTGSLDDEKTWEILRAIVTRIGGMSVGSDTF
jgi:hypothetical protein